MYPPPPVLPKKQTPWGLIIGGILLLLAGFMVLLIVGGVLWFGRAVQSKKTSLLNGQATADGEAYGATHAQDECAAEEHRRFPACHDAACEDYRKGFLKGCLARAHSPRDF